MDQGVASSSPSEAKAPNRYVDGVSEPIFFPSHGCIQVTLSGDHSVPLTIPPVGPGSLNFLQSVDAAHADLAFNSRASELLNITRDPTRMDSQAKYGCLVRGDGGVYLRMPTGAGYKEKIWVSSVFVSVHYILNHVARLLVYRITLLGRCSLRNLAVSSRIREANLSTLDLDGLWGRIMVSLLRARTSMLRSWLLFSKPWRRRDRWM